MSGIPAWWRRRSGAQRAIVVVVLVVVALDVALSTLDAVVGHDPGGTPQSSYATSADGLAALAQLYDANGLRVTRLRTSPSTAALDPASTLVVAEPELLLGPEVDALERFVRAGGRLVITGQASVLVVRDLTDDRLALVPDGPGTWQVLAPLPEASGVTKVAAEGGARFSGLGAAAPLLGAPSAPTVIVGAAGAGRVVALVDATPLENRRLGAEDNGAFALGLAGGRPVVFDEAAHGYTVGAGAIPAPWLHALVVALLAVLVAMWAAGKRFGPAEDASRPLPPPRRAYVDAVATALARSRSPAEAVAPLQRRGRERLATRLGVDPDAARAEIEAAARRGGVDLDDVGQLFETPSNDGDVIEIARAAARLPGGLR